MSSGQTQYGGLARFSALCAAASWWFQWGTGSGASRSANAVTTTSTTESRCTTTTSQVTVNETNDTLQLVGTIIAAATRAITEVGAFDAAGTGSPPTGGNMDMYGSFSTVNLNANDSIQFTFETTFA